MLQDIRANAQGTAAKIIIGLIVVAFALFGIESILLGGGGNEVAEVNGEPISPQEMQQAVNTQKRRLVAMMGDDLDPALLDDARISAQVMESLIQRKLLTQSAEELGLSISDRQLGVVIGGMEQFQVDGQFSADMYRATLADAGFTPTSFKQALADDMVVGQARSGLAGTEFVTPAELALNARVAAEQRDIRFMTIPIAGFSVAQGVSDEDISGYYQANASDFLAEENVELDYIELRTENFLEPVDEAVLRDAYREELSNAVYQTETAVSHILFEQGSDESDEALADRIAAARSRLDAGEDFAVVAAEVSDDVGSRNFGGELGYTAGDAFPTPMEEAIAALDVGELSAPVSTEAGIHLILVTDRREGSPPSFEELRSKLEEQVGMSEARVNLMRTVETLKDLAFNADNLQDPARELDLTVNKSEPVSRAQAEGLFANASLLGAAFSEEVLEAGHNSDVIELDRDHWVVLHVREHHAPEVLPLEQVRDQIVSIITEQRARAGVEAAAQESLTALRSGASMESFANERGYEWQVELGADRRSITVPQEVLRGAFALAAPDAGERIIDFTLSSRGDALVFELDRVTPGTLDGLPEPERDALRQQLNGEFGQLVDNEYQQGLRERADIRVL
jgi:peptidyl-prolyl cis-trans isomerase D